jgi:hypothetical protein
MKPEHVKENKLQNLLIPQNYVCLQSYLLFIVMINIWFLRHLVLNDIKHSKPAFLKKTKKSQILRFFSNFHALVDTFAERFSENN